jgi:hypothetical protein
MESTFSFLRGFGHVPSTYKPLSDWWFIHGHSLDTLAEQLNVCIAGIVSYLCNNA